MFKGPVARTQKNSHHPTRMEFLIAGGIAFMGYNMSAEGRRPRRPRQRRAAQLGPSNEYAEPGNNTLDLNRQHVATAEQRWREARDPQLTGIVSPHTKLSNAMLPFFRSAKSQNTNDAIKQTRLETFTGANTLDSSLTGTYRKKREVENMFPPVTPARPVTSSGSVGNQSYDPDMVRYDPGTNQNNVLPAEKVYVGRGVGVGPDVAATDGFHPMYRVMLKNVGEYKKNNLPGRINIGGAKNAKTAGQGQQAAGTKHSVNHNAGSLVYDQERRPLLPSQAAVLAPANQPEIAPVKAPRVHGMDHFGMPAKPSTQETRAFREARVGYDCGDNRDRNHALPALNPTGAVAGVGGFTSATFDRARLASQQREMAPANNGTLTGPRGRQLPAGHILPATQRDMSSREYYGGSDRNGLAGAVRHGDGARATLRDTQGDNNALFGTSAAVKGGMLDNVWRYKRLDRDAIKRPLAENHAPLPSRINVVDAYVSHQNIGVRPDATPAPNPFLPAIPNKAYGQDIGRRTTPHNKLPSANPRLQDLSLARDQLRDNPYACSLSG